jgi:hypothetical protein
MKTVAIIVFLALVTTGMPVFGQPAPYLQAKSALVLVETSGGTGSGFAVAPNLIATACHVIKGAAAIQLHFWASKTTVAGRQVLCDERADVAFISATLPEGTATMEFVASAPLQGEQIWVWGYPLGTTIAVEPSVAAGIVSATQTAREGFLALSVSGAPGNSGGPVLNAEGKVVGILVGSWIAAAEGSTGFKYAVSAATVSALLPSGVPASLQSMAPIPQSTSVRPGDGIGQVKLGMTPAEVQEAIGLPPTDRYPSGWYSWQTRKLDIYFENGKARLIDTEDPTLVSATGIHVGSSSTDLIKAYGTPVCSSVRSYRDRAYLGWYYEGLFLFLNGTPRQVFAIRVLPNGVASAVCR